MSSFNYERYDRRQSSSNSRSTLGYYVPLIFTVTVATAGLAAWVWSAREGSEDYNSDDDLSYGEDSHGDRRRGTAAQRDITGQSEGVIHEGDTTLLGRAQGIIRRTPSPQQVFDTVSKKTVAGLAAAGAAAGAALASIREEDKDDKDDFGDHSRWSEEASLRRNVEAQSGQSTTAVDSQARSFAASVRSGPSTGKRKTVVLVVSAESLMDRDDDHEGTYRTETAVRTPCLLRSRQRLTIFRLSFHTSPIPTLEKLNSLCSSIRLPCVRARSLVRVSLPLATRTLPSQPQRAHPGKSYSPSNPKPTTCTRSTRLLPQPVARTTFSGTPSTHKHFD